MTLDQRVLAELKKMQREGHDSASVKQLMERIKARGDSVRYLGALERVKGTYRRWVNGQMRVTRGKPTTQEGVWHNFVQAVLMSWQHIEKCRPYTPGEGYGWRTGQTECPDPVTHQRRLTEEGEAWYAWRHFQSPSGSPEGPGVLSEPDAPGIALISAMPADKAEAWLGRHRPSARS